MKLTKKLEKEILKLYNKYWDAYLNGKMRIMSSLMDENIQMIGSGMGEVFKNKKETVKYYKTTADQISGKSEVRNKNINMISAGSNILVTEESEFFVLIDKSWTFYGQARISTLFGKSKNKWKIIQQHGSLPDSRTGGGEQVNTDKIKEENLRLKEAIKRRTIELENKNRELEIEASLEKVRAVAMGMYKPDDLLNICEALFKEFHSFGFSEIRNAMINIHNDEKKTFLNYDYSDEIGKSINHLEYNIHPVIKKQIQQIRSADDAFSETVFKGADLKSWKSFRKKIGEKDDPRINKSTALYYYFYSIGTGSIGISTFNSIDEEKLEVLKRFRNVFKLSYQRYKDIKQAEAQAREAQIELALERVRARTMVMKSSNELIEVVANMFDGMKSLGVDPTVCNIALVDKKTRDTDVWTAHNTDHGLLTYRIFIQHFEHPFREKLLDSFLNEIPFSIHELSGDLKKSYFQYMLEHVDFSNVPEEVTKSNEKLGAMGEGIVLSAAYMKYGLLIISRSVAISNDESSILQRFAKIFEQTYTRFLDLQQAEAQAREAQIEAALERVRSRTMGMQKSEELKEVIQLVYEQFVHLNIHIEHTGFIMDYKARDDMHIWLADQHEVPSEVTFPYFDCAHWNSFIEAKEKGISFFANHLSFEEKNKFYQDLFKFIPGVPEETLKYYFGCPGLAISTVLLENVGLYIENFSGIPYTDEENNTLMRFGKVFQQTYTRFNDLKQAEAQARESQIEVALERVRAKSMAMHKSEELAELSLELVKQVQALDVATWFCAFNIFDEDPKGSLEWGSNGEGTFSKYRTPREGIFLRYYESGQRGETLLINEIGENECPAHYEYLCSLPGVGEQLLKMKDSGISFPTSQIDHVAYFKYGYIIFITFEPAPEAHEIFKRFAKVFEQTYTRFLDLQKAEAQAREAQIEAALERVRARSMAMHQSSELIEISQVIFQQIVDLDIKIEGAGFHVDYRNTDDFKIYAVDATSNYPAKFEIPYLDHPSWNLLKEAKETGKKFLAIHLTPAEKNKMWDHYVQHYNLGELPQELLDARYGGIGYDASNILLKEVNLFIWNDFGIPFSEKENAIFMRFGLVLEQTYTRFLDLKNAEAQVREAQIEAALEKVRSRSIGMQKSEELKEVIQVIHDQLIHLNFKIDAAGFTMDYYQNNDWNVWIANKNQSLPSQIYIPYVEHPQFNYYKGAKEKGLDFLANTLSFEDKNSIFSYMFDFMGDYPQAEKDQVLNAPGFAISQAFLKNITLWIYNLDGNPYTEEDNAILMRFAKVFEQTYVRFNDLKQAEEQAREAQIAVALERVRSRTMAMHQSDELAETAAVVFKQLMNLGIDPNRIYIAIIKDETGIGEFWITDEDGSKVSSGFTANLNENRYFQKMYTGWKEQKKSITVDMQGKELEEYFKHLSSLNVPFKGGLSQKRRVQNIAYFSQGFIGIASPDSQPEETNELLKRFAAVFNLTYTRFNDLKQAEAQNKIIQAENERKTKELEEARQLQLSMLPKELPVLPNLDIAVYMQTATEVGGDYYDFQVGMDGTLITVIGDATGHGMKAGTVVTITKSLFNSMAANENILGTFDKISQVMKGMKFRQLAMCLLMMKIKGNRLSISSAAMPPALIFREKNKSVDEIFLQGMPLGTMKKFPYKKIESHLNSEDRILLYSDGLPELANDKGEMFGYDRTKSEFHSVGEKEPEEIVNHLKNSASQWSNGKEPDDDVTFVVIKVK